MLANSNFARGAPTTLRSAKDQTAHTYVKYRKAGQASAADVAVRDLKRELEEKERQHFEQVRRDWERKKGLAAVAALGAGASGGGGAVALLEDRAGGSAAAAAAPSAAAASGAAAHSDVDAALAAFDDADDDEALDRLAAAEGDSDDDDDAGGGGGGGDDDEDDDEDDTAELMRELERIKREREEERARKERELAELASKETTEAILKGNPLLTKGTAAALGSAGSSSSAAAAAPAVGGVKRRFGDDTVFSHTHANEPETRKRFLNDSIRSDFHRSFMRRFFA